MQNVSAVQSRISSSFQNSNSTYVAGKSFSDDSEFLCLDKLTSCQKVGQCVRLHDGVLFPYDSILY